MNLKRTFKEDLWAIINNEGRVPKNFFKLVAKELFGSDFTTVEGIAQELTREYDNILDNIDVTQTDKNFIDIIIDAEKVFAVEVAPIIRRIERINGKNGKNHA